MEFAINISVGINFSHGSFQHTKFM